MNTLGRAFTGAMMGIMGASLVFPALGFFRRPGEWDLGPLFYLSAMPLVMLSMALFAGPGALLLSWVHAVRMEDWAPKARSVRQIRRVGVFLGLPLGIANLVLVLGILRFLGAGNDPSGMALAPWLIPALAGGAGLGWGVTIGLTPGRASPPRPVSRIRRDGPPFFDNRVTPPHRRAA